MRTASEIIAAKARPVCTVDRSLPALDAARQFSQMGVSAVVVADGNRVVGIFTERDLSGKVVAMGLDPATTTVGDVMTTPVICCQPQTTQSECVAVMTDKHIRHLPVVDVNEKLLGMISVRDLLIQEVADKTDTIRYLSEYMFSR